MRRLILTIAGLVLLSQAGNCQLPRAAEDTLKAEKLTTGDLLFRKDTIEMNVISASRSSKKITDLPITIYVVRKDEIVLNHYQTLIDVMKNLPGMRVSQPGSGELGESFQLRGLPGNLYTLILINGLPIKPTSVTGMPLLAQLPVRQAERIEVIYGPAAAIYGADAVSGVINIITREASSGTFVLGDVGLGENSYRNTDFMVGGKAGKNKNILQYTFYGSLNEIGDMNIINGYEDVYNPLHYLQDKGELIKVGTTLYKPVDITSDILHNAGIAEADFIKQYYPKNYNGSLTLPRTEDMPAASNLLGFNLRYRNFNISFNSMYRRTHSSLGQSAYLFKYDNPQNYWGENIRSATVSYNREWTSRFSTTTNISDLLYKMDNNSSMGVTFAGYTDKLYRYSEGNDLLIEQLANYALFKGFEILAGVSWQYSGSLPQTSFLDQPFRPSDYRLYSNTVEYYDTLSNNFGINPVTFSNLSVFTQAHYSYKSLRLMGGVRLDNHSLYGFSVSPRLASMYNISHKMSVRASVGFAYKAPPSSMAYQSLAYRTGKNYDSLMYLIIPNPSLEPEKYMSVELGLTRNFGKKYHLNVSMYYNEIRNLIMDKKILLQDLTLSRAVIPSDSSYVLSKSNNHDAVSRLYGLQLNFRADNLVEKIKMNAEISLSFGKSDNTFPDILQIAENYFTTFKLLPKHYGQFRISFQPAKRLYIQVSSIWESSWKRLFIPIKPIYDEIFNEKDGFYSMDIVADYSVGNNLHAFLKCNNIFDEKYGGIVYSVMNTPLPYNPQSGRIFQLGLTYTFN